MIGRTLIANLAGLDYWWPNMTGRMYREFWGRLCCLGVFIGFNLTFFPQFVMGSRGMPRRYHDYPLKFELFHVLSSIGALVMGVAMVGILFYLLYSLYRGTRAPTNPGGSATLEWTCASPPPKENFAETPTVSDPYDYDDIKYDGEKHCFYRAG